jgi:hypothetical protein
VLAPWRATTPSRVVGVGRRRREMYRSPGREAVTTPLTPYSDKGNRHGEAVVLAYSSGLDTSVAVHG